MNSDVLVYVRLASTNNDGTFTYDLYFSNTPDDVWGEGWDEYNISLIDDPSPDIATCSHIKQIVSTYKLRLAQETSCYPMEYVTYRILPLAWIDIEGLEEYPEIGRCVMYFGDNEDSVKEITDKLQ